MANLKITLSCFLFFLFLNLFAQNLVVNPGFEDLAPTAVTTSCKYTKYPQDFTATALHWNTFRGLTPDIVSFPDTLQDCIYPRPKTGEKMIGLILYHPAEDTGYPTDYHEIIQGKLKEPLQVGETYEFSLWILKDNLVAVNHLQSVYNRDANVYPVACNNLGVAFVKMPYGENENIQQSIKQFGLRPQLVFEEVITTPRGEWVQLKTRFVAQGSYKYILIGNFFTDFRTDIQPNDFEEKFVKKNPHGNFFSIAKRIAYYCIDDIRLEVARPDLEASLASTNQYTFENVQFENGKAILQPDARKELDQLVEWLLKNASKNVEIGGHTDNVGTAQTNQVLSERRAKAVHQYLVENGVSPDQVTYKGYGEYSPKTTNDTAAGRQINRRVECKILE
ncbi:MAG: OmpA family protein [Bacteroidetes bacterium]|nr:MAG: OmpA family protein [Bacteroidota bacterium]